MFRRSRLTLALLLVTTTLTFAQSPAAPPLQPWVERSNENAKVMKFMSELRRPLCLLLFLSDDYLRDDPIDNWYCVWELADAILQIASGRRSVARTLVTYAEGGQLSSKNLDAVAVGVLRSMEDYFLKKYAGVAAGNRDASTTWSFLVTFMTRLAVLR